MTRMGRGRRARTLCPLCPKCRSQAVRPFCRMTVIGSASLLSDLARFVPDNYTYRAISGNLRNSDIVDISDSDANRA